MLSGLFSDNEDQELLEDFAQAIGANTIKGISCADAMEIPPLQKKQFAGLKNQGATCYLNSFYQMMFFIPEIRYMIQNLSEEFLKDRKILMAFKKLMLNMQYLNVQNQDTYFMSDAFGWKNSEVMNQHDIQEAMRIIFDQFEKELDCTEYLEKFNDLMKGENQNFIECQNCMKKSIKLEEFFDIFINIKLFSGQQFTNLEEALESNFQSELLGGNNQYFCDNCNAKHDALKGQQIFKLPIYTCIYLNRFEFDLQTLQRKKISGSFSFPEKINFQKFMANKEEKNCDYELQGVIVHRGSPYSGHYYMMAKDLENIANEDDGPNFFELNDTLVSKVSKDHYKKFYGGKTSGYLLFYRKSDQSQNFNSNQSYVQEDLKYIQIQKENEILKEQRQKYDHMKNCVQISFVSFQNLIDLNIIDRQNVQIRKSEQQDNLGEQKITINKLDYSKLIENLQKTLQIDVHQNEFFQVQFQEPNKLFFVQKIDFSKQEDLKHNSMIVYIEKNDKVLDDEFFCNFQNFNQPIWLTNNNIKVLVNSKISPKELINRVNQTQGVEANQQNLFLNLQGDFVNLDAILKFKQLEEILTNDIEYIIKQDSSEEYYNIAVINKYDLRQIQIQKDKTVQDLKDKINDMFSLESQKFFLIDLEKKVIDTNSKLSDLDIDLFFKIKQKYDDDIELVIKEINSNYNKEKILKQHNILYDKIPSKKEVFDMIELKTSKNIKNLTFYKPNTLDEPCKRIELNKFSLKQFEMNSQYIIFVKIDDEPLDFEKIKVNIFVSQNYPIENKKVLEIQLYNELDLQTALQQIITYCVKNQLFQNDKAENYLFQFLTKEQKASQFLNLKKTKIKKVFSNNNNLLVRLNNNKQVVGDKDIVVFFRERESKNGSYGKHQEKFVSQKCRRINQKNLDNLQKEFKKALNIDKNEQVIFTIADYKQYEWKRIDTMTGNLKDGDEIGYVFEKDLQQGDNLQTDEFIAAKLSQHSNNTDIYLPVVNIQEKSFKINLD